MENKLVGQMFLEVDTINSRLCSINFLNANLSIECPWRIEYREQMYIGSSDFVEIGIETAKKIEQLLTYQKVIYMKVNYQKGDLIIQFTNNIKLIVFPNNYHFENWQFKIQSDVIVSQAGGEVKEYLG